MNAVSCTPAAPVRESLPPVQCAPWCEDGDGHTNARHVDDQWCSSTENRVSLTRTPMVLLCDDSWRLDYVTTYLVRDAYEVGARINLSRGEDAGVYLTPDEARELGETLIRLAEQA
jgi:hypothetical protein